MVPAPALAPPAANRAAIAAIEPVPEPAQAPIIRIDHIYEYRSTQMYQPSLLELHDFRGAKRNTIEFLTQGAISGEHGSWEMRDDGDALVVCFNYRWQDGHPGHLPLHPMKLKRSQPPPGELADRWKGDDDKLAEITLVWKRTLCKRAGHRYTEEYQQGSL